MDDTMAPNRRRIALVRVLVATLLVLSGLLTLSCSSPAPAPPETDTDEEPEEAAEEHDDDDGHEEPGGQDEWRADGVIGSGEYANMLDQGTYKLYWDSTESTIRLAMQAATEGWVAIGLQPGQRMKDSDIILGLVENGEVTVLDSYSTGDYGPHKADVEFGGTDDVLEVAGSESDGSTVIEFERALDTGDDYDIALEPGVKVGIIWAYGSSDSEAMRHSTRGYGELVP